MTSLVWLTLAFTAVLAGQLLFLFDVGLKTNGFATRPCFKIRLWKQVLVVVYIYIFGNLSSNQIARVI